MLSKYEIKHVILAEQYTLSRKILTLKSLVPVNEQEKSMIEQYIEELLDGSTEEAVFANFEAEDRQHWVDYYGKKAASDLLTLGKVQPETMLAMSALPKDDLMAAVKVATSEARKLNNLTIEAEAELDDNFIPNELI